MTDIDLTVPFNTQIHVEQEDLQAEKGIVVVAPRSEGPPLHVHADQDEFWAVLEGTLHVRVDSVRRAVHAGEELHVPRGSRHTYWNEGDAPCRFRYQLTPGSRFTSMMRTFAMLVREGRLRSTTDLRSIMHMAQVFVVFHDHVRASAPPQWVMATMARLGRALRIVRPFQAQ